MIAIMGKPYNSLEDAFNDYLKTCNCTTCNHMHSCKNYDVGMVCVKWAEVICEHKFVNVVMNGAPNTIHFTCTKCGKIVYYKKVEGELYG